MANDMYYDRLLSVRRESDREPWTLEYRSKEDGDTKKQTVFVPTSDRQSDDRYETYTPGPQLAHILGHLEKSIQRFPYVWPWEGEAIDAYGFDLRLGNTNAELPTVPYQILTDRLELDPIEQNQAADATAQNVEYLDGVGAYCRFTVTLDQAQRISEIALVPFTVYPMEVVSATYVPDTESHHVPQELLPTNTVYRSTDTIHIQFEPVRAKAITFVLRQKNYNKITYDVGTDQEQEELFWQAIGDTELKTMMQADGSSDTSELPAAVRQAMKRYEEAIHDWNNQMAAYQAYQQERAEDPASQQDVDRVQAYQQKIRTMSTNMTNWDERGRRR